MRSVMKHQFSQVPRANIPRSQFNRSHGYKTTFDSGFLVPIFLDEALPGDTFNLRMDGFARLATLINPIMDTLVMETFFFFVPNRLVWNNWQKFNGEQENPGDSTDFVVPKIAGTPTFGVGDLGNYFGLPIGTYRGSDISALPFRGYNLIYNEWFRDQNLQNSVTVNKGDGPDDIADTKLLRRGKRHDYFTSCLPWPQKGESITVPILDTAPVVSGPGVSGGNVLLGSTDNPDNNRTLVGANLGNPITWGSDANPGSPNVFADLTGATATTINTLRQAFQIQKLLERDARGGTRYTEIVRAHFGVISPDARLQRPEYLGGGRTYIDTNTVPQTSSTPSSGNETPQATLAAFATASIQGHGFTKSFTEHGWIFGFVNVRADLTYSQGIERQWSRNTRYDFYWPALSHIGEQSVLKKEIRSQGNASDDSVFGYQERYAEYRYKPSRVTGLFAPGAPDTLASWHLSENLPTDVALNATFIEDNPPVDRVIAVQNQPQFIFDSYFNLRCARPMPLYGVPGLIDHF